MKAQNNQTTAALTLLIQRVRPHLRYAVAATILACCMPAQTNADVIINNFQIEGDVAFESYEDSDEEAKQSGLTPPAADGRFSALEEELDRYLRHQKWPEAFSIVEAMENLPAGGFSLLKGTYRPVGDIVLMRLLELEPEGRQAYQLFNNANAEAAAKALPPTASTSELDRLATRWFLTETGSQLADRAAVASFRDGQYQRAAWWWQLLRKHHPGNAETEANRILRLATALQRSDATEALEALVADSSPLMDQLVTFAGKKQILRDALPTRKGAQETIRPGDFKIDPVPLWRHQLFDTSLLDNMENVSSHQRTQIEHALDAYAPTVHLNKKQLVVDWRHALQSLELTTGRIKWRQIRLSQIFDRQQSYRILQTLPGAPAQLVGNSLFVSVLRSKERPQGSSMIARLDANNGKVIWQSKDVKALQRFRTISNFQAFGPDTVCCLGYSQTTPPTLSLVVLPAGNQPTPVLPDKQTAEIMLYSIGTLNVSSTAQRTLSARISRLGRHVVASISTGQVISFDPQSQSIAWVTEVGGQSPPKRRTYNRYGYATPPADAAMLATQSRIIVKNKGSNRIAAISPQDGSALWYRPCLPTARLLDRIEDRFLVETDGGISAISTRTGALIWHAPLPSDNGVLRPLATKNFLTVLTSRGIAVLDFKTGNRVQFIRGQDVGNAPSQLIHTGDTLLAISSTGITCYPITPDSGDSK